MELSWKLGVVYLNIRIRVRSHSSYFILLCSSSHIQRSGGLYSFAYNVDKEVRRKAVRERVSRIKNGHSPFMAHQMNIYRLV